MMKLKGAVSMIAGMLVAASPRIASACAMCGLSPGDHAGHAFNTSVLFMLASPYVSFAAIGGITWFVYRRSTRADRDSNPPTIVKR
ncbi:MAG TPA: hypothetical protein VNO74_12435 [Methylomirabilota bacterium]|jgi:hypothetical protein|nr:hypothetical protein [Methylomirabilota bacterium]